MPKPKKKRKPLTAERLGKLLHDEFERDTWGDISPFYFKNPPKLDAPGEEDHRGLYEVLDRVAKRLNRALGT
jgi:hypothetical protein